MYRLKTVEYIGRVEYGIKLRIFSKIIYSKYVMYTINLKLAKKELQICRTDPYFFVYARTPA